MMLLGKLTIKGVVSYYKDKVKVNNDGKATLANIRKELEIISKSPATTKRAKAAATGLLGDQWFKIKKKIAEETPTPTPTPTPPTQPSSGSMTINGPVGTAIQNNSAVHAGGSHQANQAPEEEEIPDSQESFKSDTYHRNRTYIYKYDNVIPWDDLGEKWTVDTLDLTTTLHDFRESSSLLAQTQGNLNDIRILSLYSIFPIMQERNKSITRYMEPAAHERIKESFWDVHGRPSSPRSELIKWCTDLSVFNGDWCQVKEKCLDILLEAKETGDRKLKLASYVLFDLAPKLVRPVDPLESAEDTFVHQYLNCYIDNIFSTEMLFYQAWANLTLNNSTDKLKPDWTLYVKPWFTRYDLTSCEVKPPKTVGRGDISDFVKIGQELKDMLNSLLQTGVKDVLVFGILVEGANISFYSMDVIGNAYRMYQIASYGLVTKRSQLPLFPSLFDAFVHVKNKALETAIKVDEAQRMKALTKRTKRHSSIDTTSSSSSGSTSSTPTLKKHRT